MIRTGTRFLPAVRASLISNGPTPNATRYDGSGRVCRNRTSFIPSPAAVSFATGVLDTAVRVTGTRRVSSQGIFAAGSSTQGKARRASVSSNWVKEYQSLPLCWRKIPESSCVNCVPRNSRRIVTGPAGSGWGKRSATRSSLRTTGSAGTSSVPTRATTGPNSRTSALSQITSVDESSVPSISVRPENPAAEGTTVNQTRCAVGRKVRGSRMPSGATSAAGAGAVAATAGGAGLGARWAAGRSAAQAASVSRGMRQCRANGHEGRALWHELMRGATDDRRQSGGPPTRRLSPGRSERAWRMRFHFFRSSTVTPYCWATLHSVSPSASLVDAGLANGRGRRGHGCRGPHHGGGSVRLRQHGGGLHLDRRGGRAGPHRQHGADLEPLPGVLPQRVPALELLHRHVEALGDGPQSVAALHAVGDARLAVDDLGLDRALRQRLRPGAASRRGPPPPAGRPRTPCARARATCRSRPCPPSATARAEGTGMASSAVDAQRPRAPQPVELEDGLRRRAVLAAAICDSVSPCFTLWIRKVSRSAAGMLGKFCANGSRCPSGSRSRYGLAAVAGGVHQRLSSGLSSWMSLDGGPGGAGEHVQVRRRPRPSPRRTRAAAGTRTRPR